MSKSNSSCSDTQTAGRSGLAIMPNGRCVPQYLVNSVCATVTESLPGLLRDAVYTTEMLCGPDLWAQWGNGEKRSAGICLAGLVEAGELPLVRVLGLHEYPLRFRLK